MGLVDGGPTEIPAASPQLDCAGGGVVVVVAPVVWTVRVVAPREPIQGEGRRLL
jgi:hypothetical protein